METTNQFPLNDKTVEIEWVGAEPTFFRDDAAREPKRFKVLNVAQSMLYLQRDTSHGVHSGGTHVPVWVPLSKIAALRIAA